MKLRFQKSGIEAGCDEAGRGCLAGPVSAAAVILPESISLPTFLRDSKVLEPETRKEAAQWVEQKALYWCVAYCSPAEIDKWNILQASFQAMHRALDGVPVVPHRILVDGNRFLPYKNIEHHCIVKGDDKFASIAAASILAKVYRDRLMEMWHLDYPHYDWVNNKGYPTAKHVEGLEQNGKTEIHRLSFHLKSKQLSLF